MINKSRVHSICDKCLDQINWNTENHFKSRVSDFAFDDVLSCCFYGNYTRSIIYEMKLKGKTYIAKYVGLLLAERINLAQAEDDLKVDYLVPVPCSKKKRLRRGFNQTELIAKEVSKLTGIPTLCALEKPVDTKASKTVRGVDRYLVQHDAFALNHKLVAVPKGREFGSSAVSGTQSAAESFKGRRLLIVDDVITTGSTADECARVLKSAGASWVGVLCLASSAQVGDRT